MNDEQFRYIMKIFLITSLILLSTTTKAQSFIVDENDSTTITEYYNGQLWAYRQIGDYIVGMTNYEEKDSYGRYYQIAIYVKNLGNSSTTFDPDKITSELLTKHGDSIDLEVYTYDEYMKKVKKAQAWAMALYGVSAGLNSGMAGYSRSYTTTYHNGLPYSHVTTHYNPGVAAIARMNAQTQIMTLGKTMEDDRKAKEQGYLRITTIHPDESIIGYMNIKRKKGEKMTIYIPINDEVFSFDWNISKIKKKK